MESLRKQIALDARPPSARPPPSSSFGGPRSSATPSSSSTTSGAARTFDSPAGARRRDGNRPVVVLSSDDEDGSRPGPPYAPRVGAGAGAEDSDDEVQVFIPAPAPSRPPAPSSVFTTKPVSRNPFAMRSPTLPSAWGAPSSSTAPLRPPPSKQSHADPDSREETFDLRSVSLENGDLDRVAPSEADKHMRELLEGVTNEFAGDGVGWEDGDEIVDGFREGIKLMPHQILGTKWMKSRESGRKTGGILGDDMGLGKTVQSLVRIVTGPPRKSEVKAGWTGGTLIVCPLAVMSQWKQEVLNKTTKGLLSVCEHQGGDRTTLKDDLLDYDVVITTYNVIQQEHGNYLTAQASGRKAGGKSRSDSDDSDSSSDGGFGGSLGKKKKPVKKTKGKPPTKAAAKSGTRKALFEIKWHRVILDEAQNIKNRQSKTAKACIELESKYRWCLTGTPIQNNIEELYPLFAFLRIRPLNDWDYFKNTIAKPVKEGRTKLAMKKLQLVLGSIMLRRLKTAEVNGKKILNLPARTVTVVKCLFDDDEWTFYKALAERTALRMSKFMKSGSVSANYTSILTMLLRLRQACDHPELVSQSFSADPDAIAPAPPATSTEEDKEADELADLLGGLSVGKRATCTVCSEDLPRGSSETVCSAKCGDVQRMAERAKEEVEGLPPSSAKTRMILQILENVKTNSGGKEKTIIFSQFTKMLDKIEPFLRHAGHKFVRYDGSLKNDDRTKVLDKFKTTAQVNVILISFKAGSTGLNLTAANHVILVDLWWNPALEEQAFDRAHRLGQTRDVEIYKLAIEETVEDKILALQEKKRELASAALSGTKLNVGKGGNRLGVDELMMLFKGIVSPDHDEDDD